MYRAVRPSAVETPKQTGRNQQSGQGSEISGAMCLVQGCGKDLKGHDLNEYRQRCNRANGQLCKAMCMDHYRQAARSVKGMKWRDGKPIRDQQLFVSIPASALVCRKPARICTPREPLMVAKLSCVLRSAGNGRNEKKLDNFPS